jgi:hypothetical protein
MHTRYKLHRINALRAKGKRMAKARWDADRARRDAEMPQRMAELRAIEIENLPCSRGDMLGVMQWTCARTGRTRRWIIRIGDRIDRITITAPGGQPTASHGWAWFFSKLRKAILNLTPIQSPTS